MGRPGRGPDRAYQDGEIPDSPEVPDLTGKTVDEALAILEGLGRYCLLVVESADCPPRASTARICDTSHHRGGGQPPTSPVTVYVKAGG